MSEEQKKDELDVCDREISPFDAEAEPEDMEVLYKDGKKDTPIEEDLSDHTEDFDPSEGFDPYQDGLGYADAVPPWAELEDCSKLTAEERDALCQPNDDNDILTMMEEMALAEPEPPEDDDRSKHGN